MSYDQSKKRFCHRSQAHVRVIDNGYAIGALPRLDASPKDGQIINNGINMVGNRIIIDLLVTDPGTKFRTLEGQATKWAMQYVKNKHLRIKRWAKVDTKGGMITNIPNSKNFVYRVTYEILERAD